MIKRIKDRIGETFGRLTIIDTVPYTKTGTALDHQAFVKCRCSCPAGTIRNYRFAYLRLGHTKSCGCYRDEQVSKANKTHGNTAPRTKTYTSWINMRSHHKGESCIAWKSFIQFKLD